MSKQYNPQTNTESMFPLSDGAGFTSAVQCVSEVCHSAKSGHPSYAGQARVLGGEARGRGWPEGPCQQHRERGRAGCLFPPPRSDDGALRVLSGGGGSAGAADRMFGSSAGDAQNGPKSLKWGA